MSGEVISLDDFRKSVEEQKPEVKDPMDGFSAEIKADELTNLLVAGLYAGLNNHNIDPLSEENHELLDCVYELVEAIADRHCGVFNELNATRDIQAKNGKPFFLTDVFIATPKEKDDA